MAYTARELSPSTYPDFEKLATKGGGAAAGARPIKEPSLSRRGFQDRSEERPTGNSKGSW